MKRLFLIIALLVSFLATPFAVFAQTSTLTPTPRNAGQGRIQDLKNKIEARKATRAAELSTMKKDLIRKYFNHMTERMQAAVSRLNILVTRIESREQKMKLEDPTVDLTKVDKEVSDTRKLLDDAQADLTAVQANLDTVLSSQNPKEAFAVIRTTLMNIKKDLVQAHRNLVKVIGDIKGLRVGQSTSGTPKPTKIPKPTKSITVTTAPTI